MFNRLNQFDHVFVMYGTMRVHTWTYSCYFSKRTRRSLGVSVHCSTWTYKLCFEEPFHDRGRDAAASQPHDTVRLCQPNKRTTDEIKATCESPFCRLRVIASTLFAEVFTVHKACGEPLSRHGEHKCVCCLFLCKHQAPSSKVNQHFPKNHICISVLLS